MSLFRLVAAQHVSGVKESAIESQAFDKAAALRDTEKQLLLKKAAR